MRIPTKNSNQVPATLKELAPYAEGYFNRPLKDKLDELAGLGRDKSKLEEILSRIKMQKFVLETMPDVVRYFVERDQIAMVLLQDLKSRGPGPVSYDAIKGSKERGCYEPIIVTKLYDLESAGFIAINNLLKDTTFTITEMGQNMQYRGEKSVETEQ